MADNIKKQKQDKKIQRTDHYQAEHSSSGNPGIQQSTVSSSVTPTVQKHVVVTTPTPAQIAVREEYAQIFGLLASGRTLPTHNPPRIKCDKKQWCLPDVSCTARVTLSQKAIDAFKQNRKDCGFFNPPKID